MHDDGVGEGCGGELEVLRGCFSCRGSWRAEGGKFEGGDLERVNILL